MFTLSDGALKTVKKLTGERWKLLALSGCHFDYVAKGKGPAGAEAVAANTNIQNVSCMFYIQILAVI